MLTSVKSEIILMKICSLRLQNRDIFRLAVTVSLNIDKMRMIDTIPVNLQELKLYCS